MRVWSLANTKQKKIWLGLTEKELCIAITFSGPEQQFLIAHCQGAEQWNTVPELKELFAKHKDLFRTDLKPPFHEGSG